MAAELTLLRIAFTPHAYLPAVGGAERYTQGLAEALAANGHDVHVVVADIDNPEAFYELGHKATSRGNETIGGVSVHRLPYASWHYRAASRLPWRPLRALDNALSTYAGSLESELQRITPDVVVALPHLFKSVPPAFRAARSCGAAVVYAPLLHETDPNWRLADVAQYVQDADGVVALTPGERKRLLDAYGAVAGRTAVVPPGVAAAASPVDGDRSELVVYVGRLAPSKRLDVLIDAMQIVRRQFPHSRHVLAGSRDGRWQPPPDIDGIRIIEDPHEQTKQELLASAQVFANPSLTESFGIATLEAWAQGTPVVLPATPVSEAIVNDGKDGVLTGKDATSIARGIIDLLANPERARLMGEAGRTAVRRRYTWDASARSLEALFGLVQLQRTRLS